MTTTFPKCWEVSIVVKIDTLLPLETQHLVKEISTHKPTSDILGISSGSSSALCFTYRGSRNVKLLSPQPVLASGPAPCVSVPASCCQHHGQVADGSVSPAGVDSPTSLPRTPGARWPKPGSERAGGTLAFWDGVQEGPVVPSLPPSRLLPYCPAEDWRPLPRWAWPDDPSRGLDPGALTPNMLPSPPSSCPLCFPRQWRCPVATGSLLHLLPGKRPPRFFFLTPSHRSIDYPACRMFTIS